MRPVPCSIGALLGDEEQVDMLNILKKVGIRIFDADQCI
jgi:hypothetical protein